MSLSLGSLIRQQPASGRFCFRESSWVSRELFLYELREFYEILEMCRGRRVALSVGSPNLLAQCLVLLDGNIDTLMLVPTRISEGQRKEYLRDANIEVVLEESTKSKHGLRCSLNYANEAVVVSEFHTRWVIPTSGTTSTPKLVAHTLASLTDSVKFSKVASDFVWGLLYDLNRFAGLQVFLQSAIAGSSLVIPEQISKLEDCLYLFAAAGVNSISATPTLWRKILMYPISSKLELRQITLGGEISDQLILTALSSKFAKCRIIHIYASTEAGVGFSVSDGKEGFPSSFIASSPLGVEMKIDSKGLLYIRKRLMAKEYVNSAHEIRGDDGFICTGDLVELVGSRFLFRGRSGGSINVGGNKVTPEEVECVLRALPIVQDVVVFGKKSSITGELVAAKIIAKPGIGSLAELRSQIRKHCLANLESFKVPALIEFTESLEVGDSGKIVRSNHA